MGVVVGVLIGRTAGGFDLGDGRGARGGGEVGGRPGGGGGGLAGCLGGRRAHWGVAAEPASGSPWIVAEGHRIVRDDGDVFGAVPLACWPASLARAGPTWRWRE